MAFAFLLWTPGSSKKKSKIKNWCLPCVRDFWRDLGPGSLSCNSPFGIDLPSCLYSHRFWVSFLSLLGDISSHGLGFMAPPLQWPGLRSPGPPRALPWLRRLDETSEVRGPVSPAPSGHSTGRHGGWEGEEREAVEPLRGEWVPPRLRGPFRGKQLEYDE